MRYGLPYKGSKNSIAEWVVDNLPQAECFCDLFFGGGAITHRAMLSGKYKNFIANDIDNRLPRFFLDCVYGKHTAQNHTEWISREDFNKNKQNDAYIALIWSFGNNGTDYCYGKEIEDFKKALHYACFYGDFSLINQFGFQLTENKSDNVYERYLDYSKQIEKQKNNGLLELHSCLENLKRLQSLQSLQRLQSLQSLQRLQSYGTDYQNVKIPDNSVIYCDIPYFGTNCGKYNGFNHNRFYEWARLQDNIYISEYSMPDDFIPIAKIPKIVLSASSGNNISADEKIFTNKRTFEKRKSEIEDKIKFNFAQQISLF